MIRSYSGLSFGKSENQVVSYDEDRDTYKVLTIKNRCFYVKKCIRPDTIGGVAIPYKTRKDTTACLVLAIGEGCGKYHQLTEDDERINEALYARFKHHLYDIVPCVPLAVNVDDKIIVPDTDLYGGQRGISRMSGTDDEFLIHECLVTGVCEE